MAARKFTSRVIIRNRRFLNGKKTSLGEELCNQERQEKRHQSQSALQQINMDEKNSQETIILKSITDIRIAIGELEAAISDLKKASDKLTELVK